MTEVKFTKERETKGAVRFAEVHESTEEAKIGTIYLRKWFLNTIGNPTSFTITIEEA